MYPNVRRANEPEPNESDGLDEMTEKSLRDTARFAMVEMIKLTMHSINLRRQYLKDVRFMD